MRRSIKMKSPEFRDTPDTEALRRKARESRRDARRSPVTYTSFTPENVPEGYKRFLVTNAEYRRRSEEFIANLLCEGLFGGNDLDNVDGIEGTTMKQAAAHALLAIHAGGIELMWGEDGQFKGVVT
jgi:hypothetical protein